MRHRILASISLVAVCLAIPALRAATDRPAPVPAETEARLRAIFEAGEFNALSFRAAWLPDGSGYTVLEAPEGASGREIVQYAAADGGRTVIASSAQLVPPGEDKPLAIGDYALTPDGSLVLIQTNGSGGERGGRRADGWVLDRRSGSLRKILSGVSSVFLRDGISPDGGRILFSNDRNLHVCDVRDGRTIPLTQDGSEAVFNGSARWSPDGRWVSYIQTDSSAVRLRPVIEPGDPSYPEVRMVRFARVGTAIPRLRVGIADAGGGPTRWLPIPQPADGFYLGPVEWTGSPGELLIEWLSRGRDAREFLVADASSQVVRSLYRETDPAWVDASYRTNAGLEWIRGGRAFVLLSEKDGWRHAYAVSRDGGRETLLTPGPSEVIARGRVDEQAGWFYYDASPDNATQRYLYRARLDGRGRPERVTPADRSGTHTYDLSPGARWAFHTYSTFDAPPVTELVRLPDHRVVRVLEDNRALREKVAPLIARPTEFLQLDIGGGVIMDAWLIKPRDFDPARKYPVFVYVYGEPHSQTVLDAWPGSTGSFHRAIADLGYLIVSIDNRGTPAPKGAAWRRVIFGSLGPLSTEEQAAGVLELGRTRPFVDLSRVGVWGWSGGGSNTLNAMFRKPGVFHAGIAVAPKPQPHLYNAWFQEIYMRTLEENPDGYRCSAPINFAEGLRGDLLIVHGTGETNTHLQITEGLIDRLIELGKTFDYMSYPNRDHGLSEGRGTPLHLRMMMTRWLLDHLPSGPR